MKPLDCLKRFFMVAAPVFLAGFAFGQTNLSATNASVAASAEADKAWKEVLRAAQPPLPPAEWAGNPTAEQRAAFQVEKGRLAGVAADKAKEFFTRYPDHPKAAEAKKKY